MSDKILIETSARHVHVTKEHLAILFGEGHKLTNKKDLSQPGQFACEEKVTVVGPKNSLKASILGPERPETQVELSLTDARSIGVVAPVRESGDIAGSGACKLVGPCGEVELTEGVIAAKRHIHFAPADAEKFGVEDTIVASFLDTFGDGFIEIINGYVSGAIIHAARREHEMLNVVDFLKSEALPYTMTEATRQKLAWMRDEDFKSNFENGVPRDWKKVLAGWKVNG